MKLLCIASASYRGGATFSLLNTLLGLKNKGVEILVVTPEKGFLCDELKENGIPYEFAPTVFSIWPPLKNFSDSIKFIPRSIYWYYRYIKGYFLIKKIARRWRPDIIHTNVSVINVGFNVANKLSIPHLWHIREYGDLDFDLKLFPSKKIYRGYLDRSFSIAITQSLKKYYQLSDKSRVIYNGIEFRSSFSGNSIKQNKLIFVGRLSRNKGVNDIIESFSNVCQKNELKLEFWGICDPNYRKELETLINNAGLQSRISIMGATNNVYEIMRQSKAIIVASRCEGFGRITAEAMLNECLVIGRNTGGTKEQFDNGVNFTGHEIGIRYDEFSSLETAIQQLVDMGEDEYQTIVCHAKKTVEQFYSVKDNVENTYHFLQQIKE